MLQHAASVSRAMMAYCHRLVDDLPDAELSLQPVTGMNHPAWILGHLCVAADMGIRILGGERLCGREWLGLFGPGNQPATERGTYPSKEELLAKFDACYHRLAELAVRASPEVCQTPQRTPFFQQELPTQGDMVTHLLTSHLGGHLGQLSAWRRARGADPLF